MIESHEENSWRLFNQAIYTCLISCRVKSSFWVELSSSAFQLDASSWVQLFNSTRLEFKNLLTQLDTFRIEYSTWRSQSMFHEIVTFWDLAEASKEIRETCLLAMLLSRWAVCDSTDSELHVIIKEIKIDK